MFAAQKGSKECVELLVKAGSDINSTDQYGKTAKMYASGNCLELIKEEERRRQLVK